MLKAYQRRAILAFALVSLPSAAISSAATADSDTGTTPLRTISSGPTPTLPKAGSDTLWDVVARTSAELIADNPKPNPFSAGSEPRQPIGPLPGFSLAVPPDAVKGDFSFTKQAKRHSLFGSIGDWFNQLEKSTGSKIKATGNSSLTFRADSVTGSSQSFTSEQDLGRGSNGIYNNSDLSIDATLFKYLHYETRISNSYFHNSNDNRLKLDYKTKKVRIEWGDINSGFQGNSLIDFNRYLHGFALTNNWTPQLKTSLIWSQLKADTRTLVLQGNDSSGPYYAYAGQIVEGSDHVRIDNGRDLSKGQDYQLDPYTGRLTFLNNKIVPHTSTIAISFETLGYNQSQGSIYGGRAEYKASRAVSFGMTYVTQQSKGSSGPTQLIEDQHGLGASQFYTTQNPIDTTKPFSIFVNGRSLLPGEYAIDTTTTFTNRILIKVIAPYESILRVQYYPYSSTITPGSRSVVGLDSILRLGALGSLTLQTALSGLSVSGNNVSGNGWELRGDLNPLRKVHSTFSLRNISPTFSSVQSPGFNRNEKAMDFTTDYSPIKRLTLNLNVQNSKRPSYSGGTQFSIATNGDDDYNQFGLGANYDIPIVIRKKHKRKLGSTSLLGDSGDGDTNTRQSYNATFALTHNTVGTKFALGGNSGNTSDALTFNLALGSMNLDASLSKNQSNVVSSSSLLGIIPTAATPNQIYTSDSSSFSKHLGLGWRPMSWVNLRGALSDNDITNHGVGSNTKSKARDGSLSADLTPARGLHVNYTYSLSDTGSNLANQGLLASNGGINTPSGTSTVAAAGGVAARYIPISLLLTRQTSGITNGVTNGTSGTGLNTSGSFGSLFGGGTNSNLGSLGSYSGNLGTGFNNYGLTSYGGKSVEHRLSMDYQITRGLLIGTQFDTGSSIGDYQYNSSRNTVGFNIHWQPSRRMELTLAYTIQKLAYTGSLGSTDSNNILMFMHGNPLGGKLGVTLNWSLLKTKSAFNLASSSLLGTTTGTTAGTTLTDTSSNLNALGLRIEYPVSSRQTLFFESLNSLTSGYQGNTESDFKFGMDYSLTRALKFSLGWQILSHNYQNTTTAASNYHASSLLADLGFHF